MILSGFLLLDLFKHLKISGYTEFQLWRRTTWPIAVTNSLEKSLLLNFIKILKNFRCKSTKSDPTFGIEYLRRILIPKLPDSDVKLQISYVPKISHFFHNKGLPG